MPELTSDEQIAIEGQYNGLPLPMRMRLSANTLVEASDRYHGPLTHPDAYKRDWRPANLVTVARQFFDKHPERNWIESRTVTDWKKVP